MKPLPFRKCWHCVHTSAVGNRRCLFGFILPPPPQVFSKFFHHENTKTKQTKKDFADSKKCQKYTHALMVRRAGSRLVPTPGSMVLNLMTSYYLQLQHTSHIDVGHSTIILKFYSYTHFALKQQLNQSQMISPAFQLFNFHKAKVNRSTNNAPAFTVNCTLLWNLADTRMENSINLRWFDSAISSDKGSLRYDAPLESDPLPIQSLLVHSAQRHHSVASIIL